MRAPRYFASRLKGHIKAAPIVILVSLLTAAAIAFLASAVVREATSGEDKDKLFKVGIVGDMDQKYLALVVDTMRNLDDSRLSIDFVNMDEDEARDELLSGGVIGYLVIPDGFIAAAARGEFIPAYYVTEGADTALGDALVSEFIGVAERLADETQKGVFGAERYFIDNGSNRKTVDRLTDGYTLSYAEYILNRNSTLDIDLVGEAVSLPLGGYYFSAFILFFCHAIWDRLRISPRKAGLFAPEASRVAPSRRAFADTLRICGVFYLFICFSSRHNGGRGCGRRRPCDIRYIRRQELCGLFALCALPRACLRYDRGVPDTFVRMCRRSRQRYPSSVYGGDIHSICFGIFLSVDFLPDDDSEDRPRAPRRGRFQLC
jgi:hypothetical protein